MSIFSKLLNVSIAKLLNSAKRSIEDRKFSSHSHPKTYDWKWKSKGFNRIATVNHLIAITGGLNSKYLEIGCASNTLFDSVASNFKTGVDPASGGTHRMTSDEFFATNKEIFNVIFIDGLHEYEQVHRDAINALNSVEVGGFIAFHDFLPSNWKEHHVPRISNIWTGDCWKLALQLIEAKGVEFVVLDIDHGVGLMKKLSNNWSIPNVDKDLKSAEFDYFVEAFDRLPIHSFNDGVAKVIGA